MTETLTDEERARLARMCQTPLGRKALRIIDAHAAERAALVAQLERSLEAHGLMIIRCTKAEQALSGEKALHECTAYDAQKAINGLEAQVAELTRERDEARAAHHSSARSWQAEVTRLTREREASAAQVCRIARERDEARDNASAAQLDAKALRSRVRELEAQLGTSDTIPRI